MNTRRRGFFQPLPLLTGGRALLLRVLMLPNFLLTRASGLEHLAGTEGPRIFAFNHNNSFEAIMVPVFLIHEFGGRTISFVIDWMYGKVPVLGRLMDLIEPIYVYSKRSRLPWIEARRPATAVPDTLERCLQKLIAGRSIGIFPEGRRNRNPETLMQGKPGIGHIALKSGVAVVPVGIDFESRRKRGKIPSIGRTIIRVGRPLHFPRQTEAYQAIALEGSGSGRMNGELNGMAAGVTREIMLCLAELSGKQYRESCSAKSLCVNESTNNPKEMLCPV
ncbi:MAG: lysophospholipid acyltransferase family protein [Chlorobiaceae bacterium]